MSLRASSAMSKRNARVRSSSRSSAGVRRSKRSVPRPPSWRAAATSLLRELWRELPLPCAKHTTPRAFAGTTRSPSIGPLSTERRMAAPADELADLGVRHRREVLVVEADGVEVLVLAEADHVVDLLSKCCGGLRSAHRHRDDDPRRILPPDGARGGRRGRPCREPVIDDDGGPAAQVHWWHVAAVRALEIRELRRLARRGGLDLRPPQARCRDHGVAKRDHAGSDGTERELRWP